MGKLSYTTDQVGVLLAKADNLPAPSDILTPNALTSYATVAALELLAQTVTQLQTQLSALKARFETLLGEGDVSSVIDTFSEMEAFLAGVTNAETLTGLMAQQRAEIVAMIPTGVAAQSAVDMVKTRVDALETSSATHDSGIATLQTAIDKRPALPEASTSNAIYAVKNGAYVCLCDPTEQLISTTK